MVVEVLAEPRGRAPKEGRKGSLAAAEAGTVLAAADGEEGREVAGAAMGGNGRFGDPIRAADRSRRWLVDRS